MGRRIRAWSLAHRTRLQDSAAIVVGIASRGLADTQLLGTRSRRLGLVDGGFLLAMGNCLLVAVILVLVTGILLLAGSTSCSRPVVGLRMLLTGINSRTVHEDSMR